MSDFIKLTTIDNGNVIVRVSYISQVMTGERYIGPNRGTVIHITVEAERRREHPEHYLKVSVLTLVTGNDKLEELIVKETVEEIYELIKSSEESESRKTNDAVRS